MAAYAVERSPTSESQAGPIEITVDAEGTLAVKFDERMIVSQCQTGGSGHAAGIRIGMKLINFQGGDLTGMDFKAIMMKIRDTPRPWNLRMEQVLTEINVVDLHEIHTTLKSQGLSAPPHESRSGGRGQTRLLEVECSRLPANDPSERSFEAVQMDAVAYLKHVQQNFSHQVYSDLLCILTALKNEEIGIPRLIQKVATLFRGNNNLIMLFNTFLPQGHKIKEADLTETETEAVQVRPAAVAESRPRPPANDPPSWLAAVGKYAAEGDDVVEARRALVAVSRRISKAWRDARFVAVFGKDPPPKRIRWDGGEDMDQWPAHTGDETQYCARLAKSARARAACRCLNCAKPADFPRVFPATEASSQSESESDDDYEAELQNRPAEPSRSIGSAVMMEAISSSSSSRGSNERTDLTQVTRCALKSTSIFRRKIDLK